MNRLFKTLLLGMVAGCSAVSAYANVPPVACGLRAREYFSRGDAEGAETGTHAVVFNHPAFASSYGGHSETHEKRAGFTYDKAGNMLAATNADAAVSFGYDPMNRVSAVTSSVFSVLSVVNYSHDKNGNRTSLTLPGNKTITYSYDNANRLSEIDLSAFSVSSMFSVLYDAAGNPTNIVYPNGVTAAYTYDEGGRLTGLTYSKSGTAFVNRAYTYNALGQITKRTISAGLEAVPPDTHQYLRHNAADQLTHVSRMDNYENPERWRDVGPDYDANGGVTNITVAYNGLTLANAFIWDYEGRLTAYSGEHQTNLWFTAPPIPESLSFKYDAFGGRVARSTGPGGYKIHALDQAASLKNVLVERAADGTIERYYIYAPGFGLVAHIDADGTIRYYHGDHLGSTIALTDANGNVTDQFNYTPYGELMARTGTTDTPYTFCGRHGVYWEGGSLYHMKARYYRADLARFISPDPLGIAGGVNLYAYANGDPNRFLDALGLCAESYGSRLWNGFKESMANEVQTVRSNLALLDQFVASMTGADDIIMLANSIQNPGDGGPSDQEISAAVFRVGLQMGMGTTSSFAPRTRIGYHATKPQYTSSIRETGFRTGSSPGRLGSGGVYVNNSRSGAVAEFSHHNPGVTPEVLRVRYQPGIEAITDVAPRGYIDHIPLNVDSISAPSVRLPSSQNTIIFNPNTIEVLP